MARPKPISLLESRHRPPPLRDELVPRPRLLRRLLGSADLPLALVVAPAGYGKTTVLAQWAHEDRRPFAWVTLDEGDCEPRRLLASIAAALDVIEPIDSGLRAALAEPRPKAADILSGLIRSLESRTQSLVLVLDDVHKVRAERSLKALTAIVDHLPPGSQLALASRDEPRIPVGRLRANRNVVELRFRDLVMTPAEGGALLHLAGVELDESQVETVVRRAEGWPAALYLAALSLRESPDPTAAGWRGGHDRPIADYLRDEVLSEIPPDRIEFLTRAAVLDRLSGPVCDAVLQRNDSGRLLAELERSNVLVFQGEDAGYHRCHGLLAEMLQMELRRSAPELEAALHGRAAAWHAAHSDIDRAIAHAIAARDAGLAGDLIWQNILGYVSYGHNAAIQRWLGRFDDDEIAAHPSLALAAAASQLARADGNLAERWTVAAARSLGKMAPAVAPHLEGGVAILRAAAGTGGIERTLEDAARAYHLFAEDDPWRSLCCFLTGTMRHLSGARDRALLWLEEGARRGAARAPSIQSLCLAQLALIAIDQDDWATARVHASRARGQIERFGILDYPTSALVLGVSAAVHAQEGRVDEAMIDARRTSDLAAQLVDFVPWYEIEIRIVLARTALRLSDVTGAHTQLGDASRLLRQSPDAAVLHEWLEELWMRASSASGHPDGDRWSLTAAELRVLQFLPTHLSFPDIAARLNVSANTVKTHTRAVYRKLDAGSRGQAVDHARVAGLIDPGALTLAKAA